jgi:hypothetical protein
VDRDSADDRYEAIWADRQDIHEIARHTGLKSGNIAKVKFHLFHQVHWLDLYEDLGIPAESRRFDCDREIAASWERLRSGRPLPEDRQLLRHETAEAWYMRKHGPSYRRAHEGAERRFPWRPKVGGE